ncbi:MAG: hypothetical protein HRU70_13395 [Phycisphaeraceae bacterium]|nr:MAG: hypothetical protein HRU70_13395 [Phycisphaeraceae bacterium]
MTWEALAERFLGPGASAGGPFALLGLDPSRATPAGVLAALESRLALVSSHRESRSPSADELRLALHASAAQLLDPVVRGHLLEVWAPWARPAGEEGLKGAEDAAGGDGVTARLALEADAVMAMATHGGWNARTLRDLTMMADARGLSSDDVAVALRALSGPSSRAVESPAVERSVGPGSARDSGAGARVDARGGTGDWVVPGGAASAGWGPIRTALAWAAGGVVLVTLVVAGVVSLVVPGSGEGAGAGGPTGDSSRGGAGVVGRGVAGRGGSGGSGVAGEREDAGRGGGTGQGGGGDAGAGGASGGFVEADAARAGLASAVSRLGADPDGASSLFERWFAASGRSWPGWPLDARVAVVGEVVEFFHRASDKPGASARALSAVTGPGGVVWSRERRPEGWEVGAAVWSYGVMGRLTRERDLPSTVLSSVRGALAQGLDATPGAEATFELMAQAACGRLATVLAGGGAGGAGVAGASVWEAWIKAVSAVADAGSRDRLVLTALEDVMVMGPEPGEDRGAFDAVERLALALAWRAGDASRERLLRWFDSGDVSNADLSALTRVLSSGSGAEGVGATMVLSQVAGPHERALLRARYAEAWGLQSTRARGEALARWSEAARARLERPATGARGEDPARAAESPAAVADLAEAVVLSRLSEAAGWLHAGDPGKSEAILATLDVPVRSALGGVPARAGGADDGAWAVRYVSAANALQARLDLIREAQGSGSIGATDAEVLVGEAIRGSPVAVRSAARDAVRRLASSPAVVNGLLEAAPTMPITSENSALVEYVVGAAVPGPRDPGWRAGVRARLVERLIELVAGEGELGVIDGLSVLLGESYAGRLASMSGPASGASGGVVSAEAACRAWRVAVERQAERVVATGREPRTLREIAERSAGRASMARGAVQRFAAEQCSGVELLAYVVAGESPGLASPVAGVMAEFDAARRGADRLTGQVRLAERAALRVWLLRLGEEVR